MKRLIFLWSIFGFLPLKAICQAYVPFIQPGKTWQVWNNDFTYICHVQGANHCFFNGDSVVNNITYKKLDAHPIISSHGPNIYCPPFWIDPTITYSGMLLREDTTLRTVYVLNPDSTETVLFNFNLHIGDTIAECGTVVDTIILETLMDGSIVRRFELSFGDYIIESIGGSQGFSRPCMPIGAFSSFGCVLLNGNPLFGGPFPGYGCIGFVGLGDIQSSVRPEFLKTSNCIQLKNAGQYQNYHLELYDLSGKKIVTGNKNDPKLCLQDLETKGHIFIVRLFDEKGVTQSKINFLN